MSLDHLISIRDLEYREALLLLDTAKQMAAAQSHQVKKLPTLHGRAVVNLFFEDSTRARTSFETAAERLSADVISFSAKGSSLSKGESLKDTTLTLQAIDADAVVVRYFSSETAYRLAHAGRMELPVLNAGDDMCQHPTQALLDTMTLRHHCKRDPSSPGIGPLAPDTDPEGARAVIVDDVLHSRVARSNVDLLILSGARVILVAPPTLLPVDIEGWACDVDYDLDHALALGPDAVMVLRVQRERVSAAGGGFFPSPGEYHAAYGLDRQHFEKLAERTIAMHPGPTNRDLEISAEAVDSPCAVVIEQASNGVSIRMAILYLLLAPEGHSHDWFDSHPVHLLR